jgi:hypothetical protein
MRARKNDVLITAMLTNARYSPSVGNCSSFTAKQFNVIVTQSAMPLPAAAAAGFVLPAIVHMTFRCRAANGRYC